MPRKQLSAYNFKERIVNVKLKDISTWSTEHLSKKLGYRTNQNA